MSQRFSIGAWDVILPNATFRFARDLEQKKLIFVLYIPEETNIRATPYKRKAQGIAL